MTIMIGDVHGCYKTLLALLKKLPDDQIVFVGDLIDRGPSSKEVVQLVMDNSDHMLCVQGNHESWGMNCLTKRRFGEMVSWLNMRNGGKATLLSYNPNAPLHKLSSKNILPEHKKFLEELPKFYEEKDLFVSHSNYAGEAWEDLERKNYQNLQWNRSQPEIVVREGVEKYHVFGHTPVPGAVVTDYYANIDTGACYNEQFDRGEGYGILTALQWPSMKIFTQENID